MRGSKLGNEYAALLDRRFYEQTPKAVFAALAVSFAALGSISADEFLEDSGRATRALREEWRTLYANCVVPQKVPAP